MSEVTVVGLLAAILGVMPAPRAEVAIVDAVAAERPSVANPWGNCVLPSSILEELGARDDEDYDRLRIPLTRLRTDHPELFGITLPSPTPVRLVGEFEPARELVLAYRYYEEYDDAFGAILSSTWDQGRVRVLLRRDHVSRLRTLMRRWGVPPEGVVIDTDVPFDSVWIRDWGPRPVVGRQGLEIVDSRYFLNCPRDDAAPTRLADRLGAVAVRRPDLWTEGGNLLSNGAGLCFATTAVIEQNGLSEQTVRQRLRQYWGCERTVFFEPLEGNVVRHIDMMMYPAADDLVLVGRYEIAQDPVNAGVLDDAAELLRRVRTLDGRPLTVLRVPMPDHRIAEEDDPEGPLVRSYMNMLAFNEVVLVPVYDDERSHEREALEIIQRAFPERWLAPIAVDLMAEDNGTIHCVTQTIPIVTR